MPGVLINLDSRHFSIINIKFCTTLSSVRDCHLCTYYCLTKNYHYSIKALIRYEIPDAGKILSGIPLSGIPEPDVSKQAHISKETFQGRF